MNASFWWKYTVLRIAQCVAIIVIGTLAGMFGQPAWPVGIAFTASMAVLVMATDESARMDEKDWQRIKARSERLLKGDNK